MPTACGAPASAPMANPPTSPIRSDDGEVAAPPPAEGRRGVAIARDPQRLPHARLSVRTRPATAQEDRLPALGVPDPGLGRGPAPSPGTGPSVACGPRLTGPEEVAMRIESSVTSLSWIPSEAVTGANKPMFEMGVAHYDDPPPDVIERPRRRCATPTRSGSRTGSRGGSTSRAARSSNAGYGGGGVMGSTTVRLGGKGMTFAAVELPAAARRAGGDRRRGRRSCRPTAAGPRCPRRGACRARRSCSSARRSCGRRSQLTIRADGSSSSSSPARACSRGTGCTTRQASSRPRSGSPTSSSGTASRSGATRRGARPTAPRSSPRSRPRSNASSPG